MICSLTTLQIDSNNTYNLLLYGGGAFVAVWFASAIVGSIDSIPVVSIPFILVLEILDGVVCLRCR